MRDSTKRDLAVAHEIGRMGTARVRELETQVKFLGDRLEAQAETLAYVVAERNRLREALRKIAAFDDVGGNLGLRKDGDYSSFDEPGAVQTAREALRHEDKVRSERRVRS